MPPIHLDILYIGDSGGKCQMYGSFENQLPNDESY